MQDLILWTIFSGLIADCIGVSLIFWNDPPDDADPLRGKPIGGFPPGSPQLARIGRRQKRKRTGFGLLLFGFLLQAAGTVWLIATN